MNKRIVFMGTPVFAANILQELIDKNYNIVLVVSQPDRRVGRKQQIQATPVKEVALRNGIEVFQPEKIKQDFEKIIESKPDLIITAAYGQIIPDEVLNAPTIDAINIHGSLLPKYRGGAPIHYSVLNGDSKTGVTIMKMVSKMDAGDIIFQQEFPIEINDSTEDVHDKMIEIAKELICEKLPLILSGKYEYQKQDSDKVTYSPNITKEDEIIDWSKNALEVHNKIRGLNSWPGAYSLLFEKRVKIYKSELTEIKAQMKPGSIEKITDDEMFIATNDFLIKLLIIQPAGKKKMLIKDFIKGIKKEDYYGKSFKC